MCVLQKQLPVAKLWAKRKEGPNKTLIETEQAATPAEWMLRLMTAIRIFDSSKAMDHVTRTR
jgi:hypothetical protein